MQPFLSYIVGTFVALFPIANPIGAVPIFYSMTAADTPHYRGQQAFKTAINVVWVLVIFFLVGRFILSFFGISLGILRIAGGLLIAHTAWEMVTVRQRLTTSEKQEAIDMDDISFVPMAVPLISGPGAIGVVISMAEQANAPLNYAGCLVGIALLGIALYLCLSLGEPIVNALGASGIGAFNRVLGFFILAIAVQFIADGALAFVQESAPGLLQ